jgi:hypothetical protein
MSACAASDALPVFIARYDGIFPLDALRRSQACLSTNRELLRRDWSVGFGFDVCLVVRLCMCRHLSWTAWTAVVDGTQVAFDLDISAGNVYGPTGHVGCS